MAKELILNELSLLQLATGIYSSRERMKALVDTILEAVRAGALRSLRSPGPIDATLLTQGYSIAQWRNDPQVDREQRSYFRTLQTKSPYLSEADGAALLDKHSRSEFRFRGQTATGLGTALLLDALSLSLTSDLCWDLDRVLLHCSYLDEDADLTEEPEEVRHASRPFHIAAHADWLSGRDIPIRDGLDLWSRRETLFPSLVFCSTVEAQLASLDGGHPLLGQIGKRLELLERFFKGWAEGGFDPARLPMKVTPDSAATLERFAADRLVLCPDGEWRLFSWHARMTPGAWRLYFEPDAASRRAFIGYVGKKPPSVRDPT